MTGCDLSVQELRYIMQDSDIEVITQQIQKYWLQDFHRYCRELGGIIAEMLCNLYPKFVLICVL